MLMIFADVLEVLGEPSRALIVEVGLSRPGLGMTAQELCDWK